jgi:hypothetical protein
MTSTDDGRGSGSGTGKFSGGLKRKSLWYESPKLLRWCELHRQLPFWTSLCSMALAWNTKAAADCKAGRQKYCSCKALLRVVEEYR